MYDHDAPSFLDPGNPMFVQAGTARRLPNLWLATLACVLIVIAAFILATLVGVLVGGDMEAAEALDDTHFGLVVPYVMLVLSLALWLRLYEGRSLRTIGLGRSGFLRRWFLGLLAGAGMAGATVGLMALAGCVHVEPESARLAGPAALGSALLVLATFVVQGGAEEMIVRGWYLPALGERYTPWIGIAASSVLFAAMHVPTNPIAIVNLLLFGLFTALYCLREGSLWGVWGWHTAWNWAHGNFFGLEVSGHEMFGGTIVDLEARGSPLLTGGSFGPEASVLATMIFLTAIAAMLTMPRRDRAFPTTARETPTLP